MRQSVPTPKQVLQLPMDDGATIHARYHGRSEGPRLFLSHGNGFAIDGYLPFWEPLAERFELIVFDLRNHGQNARSDPKLHRHAQFAKDLERICRGVADEFGHKPSIGVFHSVSARSAMLHAVTVGWIWDALVLYDPPTVPPPDHPIYPPMCAFEKKLSAWARQRQCRYNDPSELAQEYADSRPHRNWVDGGHELMANAVLRREPSTDTWVLTCAPELEASIYQEALELNLWPHADELGGPVMLIGADPTLPGGPPTGLANRALHEEQGFRYATIKGGSHMLQIEQPNACRSILLDFLMECGFR